MTVNINKCGEIELHAPRGVIFKLKIQYSWESYDMNVLNKYDDRELLIMADLIHDSVKFNQYYNAKTARERELALLSLDRNIQEFLKLYIENNNDRILTKLMFEKNRST